MKTSSLRIHITRIVPFMIMLLCLFAIPGAKPAMAAKKSYMKSLKGINWDLKTNGKWVTYKTKFAGIGMQKQKVKITKWKNQISPTDAKILSFRVTVDPQWKLSKSQIHKIVNSSDFKKTRNVGGSWGYFILDYYTGENLEVIGNEPDVEVEDTGLHVKKTKKYSDAHGCYVNLSTVYTDVTVTYYPGTELAVGIAGRTSLVQTSADKKFGEGKKLFGKTSFYDKKKSKKVAHFKRVK